MIKNMDALLQIPSRNLLRTALVVRMQAMLALIAWDLVLVLLMVRPLLVFPVLHLAPVPGVRRIFVKAMIVLDAEQV